MPLKHANMSVSWTAARSPLNTWQPDQVYADLQQACHLNMHTWAWAEQLHAPRWIPDSQIKCIYAGFDQKCQNEREQNSCALLALTARSRPWQPDRVCAGFEQTCHLNMPTWMWAEQLHRPCPDSQITCVRVSSKHANTWAWAVTAAPSCWIADSQITSMQFSNKHAT